MYSWYIYCSFDLQIHAIKRPIIRETVCQHKIGIHSFTGRRTADLCSWSTGNANELQFMGAGGFRIYSSRYIHSGTFPYTFNTQEPATSTWDLHHISIVRNLHEILFQVIRANNNKSRSPSYWKEHTLLKGQVAHILYLSMTTLWKKRFRKKATVSQVNVKKVSPDSASNSKVPIYSQKQQCLRLLSTTHSSKTNSSFSFQ